MTPPHSSKRHRQQLATVLLTGLVASASVLFFQSNVYANMNPEGSAAPQPEVLTQKLELESTEDSLQEELEPLKTAAVSAITKEFKTTKEDQARLIVDSVFKVAEAHSEVIGRAADVNNIKALAAIQLGLIKHESAFKILGQRKTADCGVYLRSSAGACGIKQIIPRYHAANAIFKLPVAQSVPLQVAKGFEILKMYKEKSGGSLQKALQRYNGSGMGANNYSGPVFRYAKYYNHVFDTALHQTPASELAFLKASW